MRAAYLEGHDFRLALIAACDYVQHRRAELNRINVFPVPDGDTGTNFALTTRSIANHLRAIEDASVGAVAHEAAEAGILGARGNCGMILSHFLLGFAGAVGERARLTVAEFAQALKAAVEHVYAALDKPVEGTIITVMRETAEEAASAGVIGFVELFERLLARARDALARTPELLPVLKAAGVVDAGAKGYVHLLEGIAAHLSGDPIRALEEPPAFEAGPMAAADVEYPAAVEQYRYCTEALVRGGALPLGEAVKAVLRERGDSLVVIRSGEILKLHIHTDEPEEVFTYLRGLGRLVTHKAEDMHLQHATVGRAAAGHVQLARRPISILTDTACDLPDEVLTAHGVHLVPLSLVFDDRSLRDRLDIDAAAFAERLLRGEHPTTSQPPLAAFLEGFREAAEDGEAILAILLSSGLSGTFASAEAAGKRWGAPPPAGAATGDGGGGGAAAARDGVPLTLFDSRGVSLLQGLLTLKAAELAEVGRSPAEIAAELARIRDRSGLFFTVDTFDRLLASGRVGRGRAWLGSLLDIKPILELNRDGRVVPLDKVRGRRNLLPRVMDILASRVPPGVHAVRFGVVHVAAEEVVGEIVGALRSVYGDDVEVIANPATPVIGTHVGPGAWGLAYMVEE